MGEELKLKESDVYSIGRLLKKRDTLLNRLSNEEVVYISANERRTLDYIYGDHFTDIVPILLPVIHQHIMAPLRVIEQSLYALLKNASGGYPSRNDIKKVVHILCANELLLQSGHIIEPFTVMKRDEWIPVTLVDAVLTKHMIKHALWNLRFLCLGGPCAAELFWNTNRIAYNLLWKFKYHFFKLPKTWINEHSVTDYIGMRTWVFVPRGEEWTFTHIEADRSTAAYNCKVAKERLTGTCPLDNQINNCMKCKVGLMKCNRAFHYEDIQ